MPPTCMHALSYSKDDQKHVNISDNELREENTPSTAICYPNLYCPLQFMENILDHSWKTFES